MLPWSSPVNPVNPEIDAFPRPPIRSSPNPTPITIALTRCPRSVSTKESEESTPTSIRTNRNNIITAPV